MAFSEVKWKVNVQELEKCMTTQPVSEELNPEDLAKVSGGEDGGFLHQTEGALGQEDLDKVSGGEDGGFLHQTEGALGQEDLDKISGGEDGGFINQTEGSLDLSGSDDK